MAFIIEKILEDKILSSYFHKKIKNSYVVLIYTNCMCTKFLQVTYGHACTCCALVSYSNMDLQIGCSETISPVSGCSLIISSLI